MEHFDVLVVGAGPAGSATAYRLAKNGASVLLADRATFPRDKPCGGGLTMRAVLQCPVDVTPVVEDEIDLVELRFRYGPAVERASERPVILMTQRRRLDAFLLERAREAGANVREGARVTINGTLKVGGTPVRADVVVAADGANGTTARALGLGDGIVHGVALEGNAPYENVARERYEHRAVVELADIPGGYGWVFPKAHHVNIGVGAWEHEGPRLREHLKRVCAGHGVPVESLTDLRGHRLPLRRPATQVASERALLVGDAAGLVDPVSGDGLYECFVSARLAVEAITDVLAGRTGGLEPYAAALDSAVAPLHRASWKLKHALDRWPRASWSVARTRLLWVSVERLLLGELAAPGEARGVARVPLRVLDRLGSA
jgi:geranylgeranyl reductase family protein